MITTDANYNQYTHIHTHTHTYTQDFVSCPSLWSQEWPDCPLATFSWEQCCLGRLWNLWGGRHGWQGWIVEQGKGTVELGTYFYLSFASWARKMCTGSHHRAQALTIEHKPSPLSTSSYHWAQALTTMHKPSPPCTSSHNWAHVFTTGHGASLAACLPCTTDCIPSTVWAKSNFFPWLLSTMWPQFQKNNQHLFLSLPRASWYILSMRSVSSWRRDLRPLVVADGTNEPVAGCYWWVESWTTCWFGQQIRLIPCASFWARTGVLRGLSHVQLWWLWSSVDVHPDPDGLWTDEQWAHPAMDSVKHSWDELSPWDAQCRPCQLWDAMTGPLLTFPHSFESEDMVDWDGSIYNLQRQSPRNLTPNFYPSCLKATVPRNTKIIHTHRYTQIDTHTHMHTYI